MSTEVPKCAYHSQQPGETPVVPKLPDNGTFKCFCGSCQLTIPASHLALDKNNTFDGNLASLNEEGTEDLCFRVIHRTHFFPACWGFCLCSERASPEMLQGHQMT